MTHTYGPEDCAFDAEQQGRCPLCGRWPAECHHLDDYDPDPTVTDCVPVAVHPIEDQRPGHRIELDEGSRP